MKGIPYSNTLQGFRRMWVWYHVGQGERFTLSFVERGVYADGGENGVALLLFAPPPLRLTERRFYRVSEVGGKPRNPADGS